MLSTDLVSHNVSALLGPCLKQQLFSLESGLQTPGCAEVDRQAEAVGKVREYCSHSTLIIVYSTVTKVESVLQTYNRIQTRTNSRHYRSQQAHTSDNFLEEASCTCILSYRQELYERLLRRRRCYTLTGVSSVLNAYVQTSLNTRFSTKSAREDCTSFGQPTMADHAKREVLKTTQLRRPLTMS